MRAAPPTPTPRSAPRGRSVGGGWRFPGYVDDATYGPDTPHGALPSRIGVFDPAAKRFVPAAS